MMGRSLRAILPLSDIVFSAKTFVAAMGAYYIALSSDMDRPYWAVITAYIVSQPLAGAVRSKAAFRMAGTVIGAAVAIIVIANFADAQALLTLALALWVGLCTYIGILDRTPRSYLFLLAGYSAVIIAIPAAAAPDTTYATASLRVQEIVVGILCATVTHSVFFPRSVTAYIHRRAEAVLQDARRWSHGALGRPLRDMGATPAMTVGKAHNRDRRRLAIDIHELHLLSVHLPFDTQIPTWPIDVLRKFQDQISRTLLLAATTEARIAQLSSMGKLTAEIADLIDSTNAWLDDPQTDSDAQKKAEVLIARARSLEPSCKERVPPGWEDILNIDILGRLAALVRAHAMGHQLGQLMQSNSPPGSDIMRVTLSKSPPRPLHRDHAGALRAALATFLTVAVGTIFWIGTSWPDGANAVVIGTIVCALFSTSDDPAPVARRVLWGTGLSIPVCGIYALGILPAVHGFLPLVMVLAPFFLTIGFLLPRPRWAASAIGMLLTTPGLIALDDRYSSSFDGFANAALAQFIGTMLAVAMLSLVRPVGQEKSAWRVRQICQRELKRRLASAQEPDSSAWIARMTDRMGLLAPAVSESRAMDDMLTTTCLGLAIDELNRFRITARGRDAAIVSLVLKRLDGQLVRHAIDIFQSTKIKKPGPGNAEFLRALDMALRQLGRQVTQPSYKSALLALADLRLIVAPQESPPLMRWDRTSHWVRGVAVVQQQASSD
ncbi:FUSC family protein [Acidisoma silvae]|uniref:FUSC family protein n=1 Tax=Acidisoma silvae TaxID=2802396 RepID=A0A963YVF9_9PROT|nr:FUSC family protein [Acidisoma silvae]MCB8876773.1 FUSC family protein [Acidisoma silvae]